MKRVLTINAGSSSVRLAVFGETAGAVTRLAAMHRRRAEDAPADEILRAFLGGSTDRVSVAAHRIVHGGSRLVEPCRIDADVEREIERLSALAPLHNPPALEWVRAARERLGDEVPAVAVFDTAFHARLPREAASYALPRELCERHGIRRYGFHGLAHQAMWRRWRELRPDLPDGGRVVSIQLGSGCSMTAIDRGQPRDTSMGFSPLEGLVMATRSGDLDPGCLTYLARNEGFAPDALDRMLNRESGLLGMSGRSADVSELLGDSSDAARLAVEVYCHRARKYLGAYLAVLGGADGVVFGGGVGEHVPEIRARILERFAWCGLMLDGERNRSSVGAEARVSADASRIDVWVVPVDEERVLADAALEVTSRD
jgi:acetate kinase